MKKFIYILALAIMFSTAVSAHSATIRENTGVQKLEMKDLSSPKKINSFSGDFKNEIKITFTDIDGTLLKFDAKNPKTPPSKELQVSIKKLEDAKIPLILITGRPYKEAKDVSKSLGCKDEYIVSLQGAEIYNSKGQLIYKDTMKDKDVDSMLDDIYSFIKANKLKSEVYMFKDGNFYSKAKDNPLYNWQKLTTIKSLKNLGPNYSASKILICEYNPKKLKIIQSAIKKKYPNYNVDLVGGCYCDITSPTATKGNAVETLSQILGVNLKNAAVFGDSENDLSMFTTVKKSGGAAIAVDNAMDVLKNNSNYVTLSVFDGGFSKGVDEILKNNKLLKK